MIKNIVNTLTFLVLLYVSILSVNSGVWLLVYVELFVVVGLIKLARGEISWGIIFLVVGSTLIDIITYQTVGLTALFMTASLLIMKLISKIVAPIDHQTIEIKILLSFLLFYIMNSIYYFGQNILDFNKILWIGSLNTIILLFTLIISRLTKKSGNAFKI